MGRAWLVVIAGACANPGSGPGPASQLVDVKQGSDATTISIKAPTPDQLPYVLTFPQTGDPLPSSLAVDLGSGSGTFEMLAGSGSACGTVQAGIGFAIPEVAVAAATNFGGGDGPSDTSIELDGPGVGQVQISWNAPYKCNGIENAMSGVTTFTAFPNGRIVRHDDMAQPTEQMLAANDQCTCGSSIPDVTFESFYTFVPGIDTDPTDNDPGGGVNLQQGCTTYPNNSEIAVSWPDTDTFIPSRSTWAHHWFLNVQSVDNSQQKLTSAILVARADMQCQKLLDQLADTPLVVDNTTLPSTNDDGIFVDTATHTAPFDITAPGVDVPPFALEIPLSDHAIITPPHPTTDGFFIAQPKLGDPGRLVIWFRDGLAANESFHVEPK
jgi:hypothetical protein